MRSFAGKETALFYLRQKDEKLRLCGPGVREHEYFHDFDFENVEKLIKDEDIIYPPGSLEYIDYIGNFIADLFILEIVGLRKKVDKKHYENDPFQDF